MDDFFDEALSLASDATDFASEAGGAAVDETEWIDPGAALPDGWEYVDDGSANMYDELGNYIGDDTSGAATQDPTAYEAGTSPQLNGTDYSADTAATQLSQPETANNYLPGGTPNVDNLFTSASKFASNLLSQPSSARLVGGRGRVMPVKSNSVFGGLFGGTNGASSNNMLAIAGVGLVAFALLAK